MRSKIVTKKTARIWGDDLAANTEKESSFVFFREISILFVSAKTEYEHKSNSSKSGSQNLHQKTFWIQENRKNK